MDKVRFGIIGLGDIGRGHLKCLLNCKDTEIKAVCDVEPNRLNQTNFFGIPKKDIAHIPFVTDYRKILDNKEIDAVIVGVPNYLHKQIAVDAIKAGKHLFLEKPLAHTLEDARAIMEAKKASNVTVQIGLVYRYSPFYRKMANIIHEGAIGRVEMMWCKEYRQPFPQMDWFYDEKKSGGAIVEKNTHHFDVFNWMIKAKPTKVVAFGGQNVIKKGQQTLIDCSYCAEPPKTIGNSSIIDNAYVNIEYENGARANLGLCMFVKPLSDSKNELEIGAIGSKGIELMSNRETGMLKVCSGDDSERKDYSMKKSLNEFGHSGALEQHIEFIECIKNNETPFANLQIGFEALLIAVAAERSIKEGRIIQLSDLR